MAYPYFEDLSSSDDDFDPDPVDDFDPDLFDPELYDLEAVFRELRLTAALLYANEASPNRRSRTRSGSGQRRRNDVPCKFFNMGKCARGDGCRFAHVLVTKEAQEGPGAQTAERAASTSDTDLRRLTPCRYFLMGPGRCYKGDACEFSHVGGGATSSGATTSSTEGTSQRFHGSNSGGQSQQSAPQAATTTPGSKGGGASATPRARGQGRGGRGLYVVHECSICYEEVVAGKKQFGLLAECPHIFCLDCIRGWRRQKVSDNIEVHTERGCPVCRVESWFVCPSPVYVPPGPQKEAVVELYKRRLSLTRCKYQEAGTNLKCPFGSNCFYSHE